MLKKKEAEQELEEQKKIVLQYEANYLLANIQSEYETYTLYIYL